MEKGETAGKLIFFNKDTFEKAFEMEIGNSHVIKVLRSFWGIVFQGCNKTYILRAKELYERVCLSVTHSGTL